MNFGGSNANIWVDPPEIQAFATIFFLMPQSIPKKSWYKKILYILKEAGALFLHPATAMDLLAQISSCDNLLS